MTLTCVDDGVPAETLALLRAAAERRALAFASLNARRFDFSVGAPLPAGAMLYRPATSLAAMRVEQFLLGPGVASFHRDELAVHLHPASAALLFAQHGLPVPRLVPVVVPDRDLLRRHVEWLGGLPVVVKVAGGEGGVGVIRADSLASLFSVVDYLDSTGRTPSLMPYLGGCVAWRVVVVGDRAVAACRGRVEDDDFRSLPDHSEEGACCEASAAIAATAVAAARALRTYFAGVDLLEHDSGRHYLLEANSPCYFAHVQELSGVDVAGAMVDFLLARRGAYLKSRSDDA